VWSATNSFTFDFSFVVRLREKIAPKISSLVEGDKVKNENILQLNFKIKFASGRLISGLGQFSELP